VIHRFFVQQERVFITRMASFPELPQAYEGSRLQ
jgi:hypothetical protein